MYSYLQYNLCKQIFRMFILKQMNVQISIHLILKIAMQLYRITKNCESKKVNEGWLI